MLQKYRFIVFTFFVCLAVIGLVYAKYHGIAKDAEQEQEAAAEQAALEDLSFVRGIQPDDHILGNPKAPIVFFVYSDFGCTYCKDYHKTMRLLTQVYGGDGKMAWVFRHLPYVQLHPEAPMYALASECVASELGNDAFWAYTNLLFENADPLNPLSASTLVELAASVGVNRQTFVTCMRSNELMDGVQEDFEEGMTAGAQGTPYTIVETPDGRFVYQGAQPYRVLAIALQDAVRAYGVNEIMSPDKSSSVGREYMNDFDAMFASTTASTSSSTPTPTPTPVTTPAPSSGAGSILDGIITD